MKQNLKMHLLFKFLKSPKNFGDGDMSAEPRTKQAGHFHREDSLSDQNVSDCAAAGDKRLSRTQMYGDMSAEPRTKQAGHFHRSERGMAMLFAMSILLLIMYFATEILYDSSVEYTVNANRIHQIKAYYAAKASMDLALLRIKAYQKAQQQFGAQLGDQAKRLDQIITFPFQWPIPPLEDFSADVKDSLKTLTKESTMDAQYTMSIEDEGSRIDINDLGAKNEKQREITKKLILQIFENKMTSDKDFADRYQQFRFDELVNRIGDWTTSSTQSLNGGDKLNQFMEANRAAKMDIYPPNRPFRTIGELKLIPGMNAELFELLEPKVTVFGLNGVNPNYAPKEVLLSLDKGLTEEVIDEVINRRNDEAQEPFKTADEFWQFVQEKGARLQGEYGKIPLVFDRMANFRIRSTGTFGKSNRQITAIVLNIQQAADKLAENQKKSDSSSAASGANPADPNKKNENKKQDPLPKGRPRIVYWIEQ